MFLLSAQAQVSQDTTPGKPVVGRNADGYLEVFRVGTDHQLEHRFQKRANGDWSGWSSLGGSLLPGIAVANNAEGLLEVFAVNRTTHALWHIRQLATNSPDWTLWSTLGGSVRPPLAVAGESDGRLEVFALAAQGDSVRYLFQEGLDFGEWSPWTDLAGHIGSDLVAVKNDDDRLELFGLDAGTRALVHCWQRHPSASSDWTEWASLGGDLRPGIAAGVNARGMVEAFAVDGAGVVQRIWQQKPGASQEFSPWKPFGGDVKPGLAVGQSADGRLELIAVQSTTGMLLHRWEILNDGSDRWSAWTPLGHRAAAAPALGQNEDGNLEIFAEEADAPATLVHRRQISRASDWLDWSTLDHQTLAYSSRAWQIEEGLPDNVVQAIAQTPDRYLWVGTRAGLARFDGVTFTPFAASTAPELRRASITSLCVDHRGALWIGTDGAGLFCLESGTLSRCATTNGLAADSVTALYEGRDGSLWAGTTNGLSRLNDGSWTHYRHAEGLLSNLIRAVRQDREGEVWIATGEGLNCLRAGVMESYRMPNGLPNDSVRVICEDRAGRIWIGSNNGMLWYNSFWKSFYAYNSRYGLSDTFVSAICEDREGNLWVGTYSGLNRFRSGRFYTEWNNEGAPFDRVNTLFEDRDGSLWIGSREGLARLTARHFVTYTRRNGLTHNNVSSVLEDQAGTMWIGTWGGGLDRGLDEQFAAFSSSNAFAQDLVLGLCQGRDGTLWVGTDYDGGLTRIRNGNLTHFSWHDGLPKAGIRDIKEDRAGHVWLATRAGLGRFKDGKFACFTVQDGLPSNAIRAICEDHAGRLWFGTEKGLSQWQGGRFVNYNRNNGLSDDFVTALYEDKAHRLWIGTASGGLNRFEAGKFHTYTTRQGLWSDEIFDMVEDEAGCLWMSCSRGVFSVRQADLAALDAGSRKTFPCTVYDRMDGMETTQCNGLAKPGAFRTRDGRLWFATTKGVTTVRPATLPQRTHAPPVLIEQVIADRKPATRPLLTPRGASPATGGASTWGQLSKLPTLPDQPGDAPLKLPPGRGELEFRYTALDLRAPESCHFKYRLEGADTDWIDAGPRRTAHYNNLEPGRYEFHVIACGQDGIWSDQGASLRVFLRPHFWQTWWWRGSLALGAIGAASGAARYATRKKMQRKLRLLEQRHAIEKERGRIAKDIHDDVGSSLTRIMMLGERADEGLSQGEPVRVHLDKIVDSARHTVRALDEIVWAVNPDNDSLEGLIEYISHYADELFENTAINCRLEMPDRVPDWPLPAEFRHDLFLAVKEALHNVLKHARASEVHVRVAAGGGALEIAVEDNGCGFVPGQAPQGRRGNGLGNMRQRLNSIGGLMTLASEPGRGTRLRFDLTLHHSRATTA